MQKSNDHLRSLMEKFAESTETKARFRATEHTGQTVMNRAVELALAGEFGPELKLKIENKTKNIKDNWKAKLSEITSKRRALSDDDKKSLVVGFTESVYTKGTFSRMMHLDFATMEGAINMALAGDFGPELKDKIQSKIRFNEEMTKTRKSTSFRVHEKREPIEPKKLAKLFIKSSMNQTDFLDEAHVTSKTLKKAIDMAKAGSFGPDIAEAIETKLKSVGRKRYERDFAPSNDELKAIAEQFLATHKVPVVKFLNQMDLDMPTFDRAMALYAPEDWIMTRAI